jgi:general secretion pathway protein G
MLKENTRIRQLGFTLVELMVVVAIIALLTAAGLVSYRSATISSHNSKRKADLEQIKAALVLYRYDNGTYPPTSPSGLTTAGQYENPPYTTLQSYLSGQTPQDPKNTSPYIYTYATDTRTFSLCANLETTQTQYCVTNP